MLTIFLDVVFKPFLKIVHDMSQQLTIDLTNFLMDGFLQIIKRTGFVSVNTWFQITPKKKITRWKDWESEGATARLRNGKWGARETQTRGAQQAKSPLLLKWPTQRKRMPTTSSPPLSLPTEYYPFKRCQVPVDHPVQVTLKPQQWT